jgi:hydroxylamine reductase
MFCYQCEQTARGTGCTIRGVCGKSPEVAALQDLLIYTLKGLSHMVVEGKKHGISDPSHNQFVAEALFSTITNANFDPERFPPLINKTVEIRDKLKKKIRESGGPNSIDVKAANLVPKKTIEEMVKQGEEHGIKSLGLVLKCGEINLRAMELLDAGNTGHYGHPVPTEVPLGQKKGKAILVSGHDLKDLEQLLEQTEDKGIYVYTHGEMLPTHGYPKLKKHPHFYGHFGTAWQNQTKEFQEFPGAILMTTNCIQRPAPSYKENIFTTGLVGWPSVVHIEDKDFTPIIERALELPGFKEDSDKGMVTVGFARNTVMGVANRVIEAVKAGDISHFFLVGGCDGAKATRNYYTKFVEKAPEDTIILTLACGKFKFFNKKLGNIDGIPRLMDVGQCNDAYSAIQIALALSDAFEVSVNELPLSLILSWYEQKAVAILLTLLHLGIKDIRLGPSLPAVITPNILDVLASNFNIMPITTPEEDLKAILS